MFNERTYRQRFVNFKARKGVTTLEATVTNQPLAIFLRDLRFCVAVLARFALPEPRRAAVFLPSDSFLLN